VPPKPSSNGDPVTGSDEGPSHVYEVTVHHDRGCPCLAGQPLTACTCKTVDLTGKRIA
jgi:hypothetical protein